MDSDFNVYELADIAVRAESQMERLYELREQAKGDLPDEYQELIDLYQTVRAKLRNREDLFEDKPVSPYALERLDDPLGRFAAHALNEGNT